MSPTDTTMYIEPGLWGKIEEEQMALELEIAQMSDEIERLKLDILSEANEIEREKLEFEYHRLEQELAFKREELALKRQQIELELSTSPIDFVAYEQYKRDLQAEGHPVAGVIHTDEEIQAMLIEMTGGADVGGGLGAGRFGVDIPTTQQISRGEFMDMSPSERAILASFLRAGVAGDPTIGQRELTAEDAQRYIDEAQIEADDLMHRIVYGEETELTGADALRIVNEAQARADDLLARLAEGPVYEEYEIPTKTSFDPDEYYSEMQEGFVPIMQETGPTRYSF